MQNVDNQVLEGSQRDFIGQAALLLNHTNQCFEDRLQYTSFLNTHKAQDVQVVEFCRHAL